jgi:hypothetical protein
LCNYKNISMLVVKSNFFGAIASEKVNQINNAMSESKVTTDHNKIREWAESRGGKPAEVKGTGDKEHPGLLRFSFQDKEDNLEQVSWEGFFKKFDENNLAMLYQEETKEGKESRFFKFVDKNNVEER